MPYVSYTPTAEEPVQRPLRIARAAAGKRERKYSECILWWTRGIEEVDI
jgi:hypothetical protein